MSVYNILDADTLINNLNGIDYKLSNNSYKYGGIFPMTKYRYSISELLYMYRKKLDIINELHKRNIIDREDWVKYILSEDPKFTPKIKI